MSEQLADDQDISTKKPLALRRKICFSLATVIAFFAILETVLRAVGVGAPPVIGTLRFGYEEGIPTFDSDGIEREGEFYRDVPLFEADPVLFWKPIAHTRFTGVEGLRLPTPPSREKGEGVYRVGVIGDSCSFLGIDLYPNRFAELVERNDGVPVEIINASCPGYTSFQGALRLEDVWPWDVDAIIVYFGWNDHWKSLNGQTDRDVKAQQLLHGKAKSWLGYSRLFWCLHLLRSRIEEPVSSSGAPLRVPPEHYGENLRRILREAEEHGCHAIFITAPSAFVDDQMPEWAYTFFGQVYEMSPQEVAELPGTHAAYNDIVRQVAGSSPHATLLDIAQPWSEQGQSEQAPERFRGDRIHLTETGHAEIARELYRLWHDGLIPASE